MSASISELYVFLKSRYKHGRFEGRNNEIWGKDYSKLITNSVFKDLQGCGWSLISKHSSNNGETIYFDDCLNVLDGMPIGGLK